MDAMELVCIGTGTVVPDAERVCAAFALHADDVRFLFDCGPGAVHHMARFGVDWKSLTHVAISHLHNDHIGDLPALFFAWKHGMRPAREAGLQLFGPRGASAFIDALPDALGAHVRDPGFALNRVECDSGAVHVLREDAVLRAHDTLHTANSLAYRLDIDGRAFGYTGDTGPDVRLGRFFEGVDILVAECSLPDEEALPNHLSPRSVAALALDAQPGVLVVTHVYPQLDAGRLPDLLQQVGWKGPLHIARDGDRLSL
jgi:ribonuclease BN (tRNA processing enzyme)